MQQHWLNQQQETCLRTINIFSILFGGARGAEFLCSVEMHEYIFNVFQLNDEYWSTHLH